MANSLNHLPTQTALSNDFNQLLRQLFEPMGNSLSTGLGKGGSGLNRLLSGNWAPTVDIRNEPHQFIVHADVPGVNQKDIEVSVTNGNTLIISGKKEAQSEKRSNNYLRIERSAGTFCRNITLPGSVNATKIRAKVKNGVLEIIAPKLSGKGASRKIKVKTEKA